jgi:hypothetical protein
MDLGFESAFVVASKRNMAQSPDMDSGWRVFMG